MAGAQLFTANRRQPMPGVRLPDLSAVLVPAPGPVALGVTRERVLEAQERLAGLARHQCAGLRRTGEIDYEGLLGTQFGCSLSASTPTERPPESGSSWPATSC